MIKLNSEALSSVSSGMIVIETEDNINGEIFVFYPITLKVVAKFSFHSEEEKWNACFEASQIDRQFYGTDKFFPLIDNNF